MRMYTVCIVIYFYMRKYFDIFTSEIFSYQWPVGTQSLVYKYCLFLCTTKCMCENMRSYVYPEHERVCVLICINFIMFQSTDDFLMGAGGDRSKRYNRVVTPRWMCVVFLLWTTAHFGSSMQWPLFFMIHHLMTQCRSALETLCFDQ